MPPYPAGRDRLLDAMGASFDNGLGDPNLCTLIMAGLPANVTDLVEDKRVSFLRRASYGRA